MTYRKSSLLAAVSVVSILAAAPVALAANQTTPTGAQTQSAPPIDADRLIGKDLINPKGEKVGEIESVLIDQNNIVAGIVVGVGGFLGIGERDVAIDWRQVSVVNGGEKVTTTLTAEELKAMPPYEYKDGNAKSTSYFDPDYIQQRASTMADDATTAMNNAVDETKKMAGVAADKITGNGKAEGWVVATGDVTASHLMGAEVVDARGEEVGEVDDVVLAKDGPKLVLDTGKLSGAGSEKVVLKLDDAEVLQQRSDPDDLRIKIAMSDVELKALPRYTDKP